MLGMGFGGSRHDKSLSFFHVPASALNLGPCPSCKSNSTCLCRTVFVPSSFRSHIACKAKLLTCAEMVSSGHMCNKRKVKADTV